MNINRINDNSTAFKKLYSGETTKRKLCSPNCPKNIVNKFVHTRNVIRKAGINKLNSINIVLEYNEHKGFEAVIQSLKGRLPRYSTENPIFTGIVDTEKCIEQLKKWGHYDML